MCFTTPLNSGRYAPIHLTVSSSVFISGSDKALGKWDVERAVPMTYRDGRWTSEQIYVSRSATVEYKYLIKRDGSVTYQEGLNYQLPAVPTDQRLLEVHNEWPLPATMSDTVAKTSTFTKAILHRDDAPLDALPAPVPDRILLVFTLYVPWVEPDHGVYVCGSHPALGIWDPRRAVPLKKHGELYAATIFLGAKDIAPIEYKFFLGTPEKPAKWEAGDNRTTDTLPLITVPYRPQDATPALKDTEPTPTKSTRPAVQPISAPIPEGVESIVRRWPVEERAATVYQASFRYGYEVRPRVLGVVVPVFSLRSRTSLGVGEFLDMVPMLEFIHHCGGSVLQILPVNDTMIHFTHRYASYPYSTLSVFALHPQYARVDDPATVGPLPAALQADIDAFKAAQADCPIADYETVLPAKLAFLRRVYEHQTAAGTLPDLDAFIADNEYWLPDYAVFKHLADENKTCDFNTWPVHSTFTRAAHDLISDPATRPDVLFHVWCQHLLVAQFAAVQTRAHDLHMAIKGDIPIGVDPLSCDVWRYTELFNTDTRTGAPPDMFSASGQCWGFPTYNWEAMAKDGFTWWAQRLGLMAKFFDAYRIDHVLGFFRIWRLPATAESGIPGFFHPSRPIHLNELKALGLHDIDRYTTPYLPERYVYEVFEEAHEDVETANAEARACIKDYLVVDKVVDGTRYFRFKEEFATETAVCKSMPVPAGATLDEEEEHRARLLPYYKLLNSVCLYRSPFHPEHEFYPRFGLKLEYQDNTIRHTLPQCASWRDLSEHEKTQLADLEDRYFYNDHDDIFREAAHAKLPAILAATDMLICGEDLGLLAPCVTPVMKQYAMLGLRVQRFPPPDPAGKMKDFAHCDEFGWDNVATPGTHDMETLRSWWAGATSPKEQGIRQAFWTSFLREAGDAWEYPADLSPAKVTKILEQLIHCPALMAMVQIQDLLAMTEGTMFKGPVDEENINKPSNPRHYWRYRMHCDVADLDTEKDLIAKVRAIVDESGRGRVY